MTLIEKLLKKWGRRADVGITQWGEYDVLRFGKGGGTGGRSAPVAAIPYAVPAWVKRRIGIQRARLKEEARLKRYAGT